MPATKNTSLGTFRGQVADHEVLRAGTSQCRAHIVPTIVSKRGTGYGTLLCGNLPVWTISMLNLLNEV
jgi:hypothetical protein